MPGFSKPKKIRDILISLFVILWLCLFQYESVRYFYLQSIFQKPFPKTPMLFPSAGWVMFFRVDDRFAFPVVYGKKNGRMQPIDPHKIIKTRFVGFDNVHRGVLGSVFQPEAREPFCQYLRREMPGYDKFVVTAVQYPAMTEQPLERDQGVVYECP